MSSVSGATRKKVQRKFKIRGFTLKVDALEEVLSFLSRFQDAENEALDLLLDEIDNESRNLSSLSLSLSQLVSVFKSLALPGTSIQTHISSLLILISFPLFDEWQ